MGSPKELDDVSGAITDAGSAEAPHVRRLLAEVELPVTEAELTMTSGRRYSVVTDECGVDRLRIHGGGGQLLLSLAVTDAGPVLTITGVELQLEATRTLRMAAQEIQLQSSGATTICAGGDLRAQVGGDHHTSVSGTQRAEASAVEVQASHGHVAVRALAHIALDGEHIGLNDDPLPRPFDWSSIAFEQE